MLRAVYDAGGKETTISQRTAYLLAAIQHEEAVYLVLTKALAHSPSLLATEMAGVYRMMKENNIRRSCKLYISLSDLRLDTMIADMSCYTYADGTPLGPHSHSLLCEIGPNDWK